MELFQNREARDKSIKTISAGKQQSLQYHIQQNNQHTSVNWMHTTAFGGQTESCSEIYKREEHPSESRVLWRELKAKAAIEMMGCMYVDTSQVPEGIKVWVNVRELENGRVIARRLPLDGIKGMCRLPRQKGNFIELSICLKGRVSHSIKYKS